jgi:hypothetical protein
MNGAPVFIWWMDDFYFVLVADEVHGMNGGDFTASG